MKQETLEEAVKSYCEKEYSTPKPLGICIDFAKLGANWQAEKNELRLKHKKALLANCEKCLEMRIKQAERMYSEEEVLEILFELSCNNDTDKEEMEEWFKQFKKK